MVLFVSDLKEDYTAATIDVLDILKDRLDSDVENGFEQAGWMTANALGCRDDDLRPLAMKCAVIVVQGGEGGREFFYKYNPVAVGNEGVLDNEK